LREQHQADSVKFYTKYPLAGMYPNEGIENASELKTKTDVAVALINTSTK